MKPAGILSINTMKKIPLTQGLVALVDDEDYEMLSEYKWHILKGANTYYAMSYMKFGDKSKMVGGKREYILMHRIVLRLKNRDEARADHADGNGLNNQKSNLRFCTNSENMQNKRKMKRKCSSKYKGVSLCKKRGKWASYIFVKSKQIFIGYFYDEIEAAKAYDIAAIQYFGKFAYLNFKIQ